ncbi:MAG: hypothetical protein V1888_01435 [archaeon]
MEEYKEKYDFPNVGMGYINGLGSANIPVTFSVNFKYENGKFVSDVIPSTKDLRVARGGLEGFAKAVTISSNIKLVPFDDENRLEYFYVGYPRPKVEEVMADAP